MLRPNRRLLGASGVLFLLILIAISAACSAAVADVPPEDKPAESGEDLKDDDGFSKQTFRSLSFLSPILISFSLSLSLP